MSKFALRGVPLVGVALLLLAACGGGSNGFGVPDNAIRVASTAIPPKLSGETVDHVIPLQGGCGGPYVMKVIAGQMPPGLYLDGATHSIRGFILDDGAYSFTVQIDDTGCKPFSSTTANFSMSVGVGAVAVVEVQQDGNPSLIPTGGADFNPDYPALPTVVYNDFTALVFVVAGGVGPYSMKLYDDPNIPNDGNLPLGVAVPAASTSIVGAPVQVGPNGGPFLLSFEVTDSVGEKAYFTAYWKVDTPSIVVASESIGDGQAGVQYSDQFFVVEGVPPFTHEFVEQGLPVGYTSDANPNPANPDADVLYNPGAPPTVDPPEALVKIDASAYPAPTALGPAYDTSNQGVPSEGVYIVEATGAFTGIPRRRGTFSVNYHVRSTLVPNSFGQHAWATFPFQIVGAPPIAQNPAYTLGGAFKPTQPYAEIAQAEQGSAYNPDGGPPGLQLLGGGGVPQDGRTDAPHLSQTAVDPLETNGAYQWAIDWDPDSQGTPAIYGMELTLSGIFRIVAGQENNLVPQFDQALGFTAIDFALPVQLATTGTEKVNFSIGPDRIIVTESSTSFTTNYDNRAQNDTALTLKVLIPHSSAADELRAPNDGDLVGQGAGKIGVPAEAGSGTTVGSLLSTMDITRIAINPTGWWDDTNHLNPRAARPYQDGDRNSNYTYYGLGYFGTTYYLSSSTSSYQYQQQSTALALRLPKVPTVTADNANGVYNDGGKFYLYETDTHLGVFVIRKDGRLYLPAAFKKSTTGWVSFGDNWNEGRLSPGQSNSATKIPEMTVSPDGRLGALKLRKSTSYDMYESASTTGILLLSLTGERISAWGDEVYKVITTGSNGSASQGQYQFASSLTLTNGYLYYLIGSGSTVYMHWKDHYIYRYDLFGGDDAGALLHSNFNSEWTNSSGSAMQTPFQDYYNPFFLYQGGHPLQYASSGHNCMETSYAPHPFRVSANGNACAILAGRTTTSSSGSDVLWHHVWVDYQGSLHQLSSQRRHTTGGGRGISLFAGPMDYPTAWMWGAYTGPTSRFEISDDGLKVAVTYHRSTSVNGAQSYSTYPYVYRSDIAAYTTTAASQWGSVTIHEVTGDSSTSTAPSSAKFSTPHTWRFGALTFTADGNGLVFWGGYSNYSPSATYMGDYYMYNGAKSYVGSIYSYSFSDSSVRNILATNDGGCNKTVGSAFTSTSFSTSSWSTDGGVIKPFGGFLSQDRNFLYIVTRGAVNSSDSRDGTLLGVNVRSLDTSQSINGKTDGRAFRVGGFATTNGFYPIQYYVMYLGLGYYYGYPGYNWYYTHYGDTQRATATDSGWVYFVSEKNVYGYSSTGASSLYGGAVNNTGYTYGYLPKYLYVFNPNLGANVQLIAGDSWSNNSSYHAVGGVVVSDDGTAVATIDSTAIYYNWNGQERLNSWSGVQLSPTTGSLVGTPTGASYETNGYVSSHIAFSPKLDKLFYAVGTGNENSKTLKVGKLTDGSKSSYAFTNANYCVLHAGR